MLELTDAQRNNIARSDFLFRAHATGSRGEFKAAARAGKLDYLYAALAAHEAEVKVAENAAKAIKNEAWRAKNLPRLAAAKRKREAWAAEEKAATVRQLRAEAAERERDRILIADMVASPVELKKNRPPPSWAPTTTLARVKWSDAWTIDSESAEILLDDAEAYASFLFDDQGIPHHLAFPCAAFQLLAKDMQFFCKPRLFAPGSESDGVVFARVYFRAWSQNSRPALRLYDESCWFCPESLDVFTKSISNDNIRLRDTYMRGSFLSGSKTRDALYEALEMIEWLREALENR